MIPETLSIEMETNSQSDVFIYKKFLFDVYPTDLVNTKTISPSESVYSVRYIPRRFVSRYILTTIHLPFGGWLYDISAE